MKAISTRAGGVVSHEILLSKHERGAARTILRLSPAAIIFQRLNYSRATLFSTNGGRLSVSAAVPSDGPPDAPSPSAGLFTGPQPTIIAAGFYIEELPAVRQLLDAAGGRDIIFRPCMPWLLEQPLSRALDEGEPHWDQPMSDNWIDGGGWGKRKVVLFNDLTTLAQNTIVLMLESSPVGDVAALKLTASDLDSSLGFLLAKALDERPPPPGPASSMNFVENLPSVEEMIEEMIGEEKAARSSAFEQASAAEQFGGEMDIIDKIASGVLN